MVVTAGPVGNPDTETPALCPIHKEVLSPLGLRVWFYFCSCSSLFGMSGAELDIGIVMNEHFMIDY